MCTHAHHCDGCPSSRVSRRGFLAAAGVSAAAMQMGLLEFTSTLVADETRPKSKPRVRLLFIRPKDQAKYWMSWPGNDYNADERQADFTRRFRRIARKLDIQLEVDPAALEDAATVNAALERMKQSPPDGILVIQMHLSYWKAATDHLLNNRGNIPTIVLSRLGTSFTGHLQTARKLPNVCVAATDGPDWLSYGMRMFKTMADMKRSRLCIITGNKAYDRKLDVIGTTLHYIPLDRWVDEVDKAETTDEVRALANYYTKHAKELLSLPNVTLQTSRKFVVNSFLALGVCKELMSEFAATNSGFTNCMLGSVVEMFDTPPCLVLSLANDEGHTACCHTDLTHTVPGVLLRWISGKPTFLCNSHFPHDGIFTVAHCSAPRKMNGKDYEPAKIMTHFESDYGAATKVEYTKGQVVTVIIPNLRCTKWQGFRGRVFDSPSHPACRSQIDIAIEGDSRQLLTDMQGFHVQICHCDYLREVGYVLKKIGNIEWQNFS